MIKILESKNKIIINIRARPGAKQTKVLGEYDGAVRIALAAPPEKGKANKELVRFLAKEFKVTQTDIKITGGETSKDKRVLIRAKNIESIKNKISEWNN